MAREAPIITLATALPSGGDVASIHLEWQISFGDAPNDRNRVLKTRLHGPNNFLREFPVTNDSHFSTDIGGLPANADVALGVCSVFQDGAELCSNTRVHTQGGTGTGVITPTPKPPAPRINSLEPHQATLHSEGSIVARWTATTNFDQYHVIFQENKQEPVGIEINSEGTSGFFQLTPAFPGRVYAFKVQGCIVKLLGLNNCSHFTDSSEIVMPENTHSLRDFLRLSGVHLNPGIRSLGESAFSSGIRAMMRL